MKKTFHELQDETLIAEAGGDMCSVPLEKLRSKAMIAIHKKKCVDPKHWSTTDKKSKKSMWSKAAQRAASSGGHKLHNSVEESQLDQNLVDLMTKPIERMLKAAGKGKWKEVLSYYKELGRIIK